MRFATIISIFSFISLFALDLKAQIVNIPDARFKAACIHEGIDLNGDGEIQVSEAEAKTGTLFLRNWNIESLVGIEAFTSIHRISASSNKIASLENIPLQIQTLELGINLLTSIDLSYLKQLIFVSLKANLLKTIDLSQNPKLAGCYLDRNPELISINIKNGAPFLSGSNCCIDILSVFLCDKLEQICCNEEDYACLSSIEYSEYLPKNVSVNSFCEFDSDILANKLQIQSYFIDEYCDPSNFSFEGVKYQVSNGLTTQTLIPNNTGNLISYVEDGTYRIRPIFENEDCYFAAPEEIEISFPNNSNEDIPYFCIDALKTINDIELKIIPPLEDPRPSQSMNYTLVIKNLGSTKRDANICLNYDWNIMNYTSSNPLFTAEQFNKLTWEVLDLSPFGTREIDVSFLLNGPMDDPPLNQGDELNFISYLSNAPQEDNVKNDSFNLSQVVVNSFDPNDITCLDGEEIPLSKTGDFLLYRIRFENLGNANAINIKIVDSLDIDVFEPGSFQVLGSSHDVRTKLISNNIIEFYFLNINLPFAEGLNQGFVTFKIRTKKTLIEGDLIANKASIFFDTNEPIITNTYKTRISEFEYDFDYDGYTDDDCDKHNPFVNPGQTEIPYNNLDDDCDELTLDDDLDQDGYLLAEDCDDQNADINPGQTEIPYNDLDDDCDSLTLDNDLDQDGFLLVDDCDDQNPGINPDAI